MNHWDDGEGQNPPWPKGKALLRVLWKVPVIALVIFGLMGPMVILRLAGFYERSQSLVQLACRITLRVIGVRLRKVGQPETTGGAVVANHSSWLDIFALNATQKVSFVSKAEVQNWPLIGVISRSTGTVFIERRPSHAMPGRAPARRWRRPARSCRTCTRPM